VIKAACQSPNLDLPWPSRNTTRRPYCWAILLDSGRRGTPIPCSEELLGAILPQRRVKSRTPLTKEDNHSAEARDSRYLHSVIAFGFGRELLPGDMVRHGLTGPPQGTQTPAIAVTLPRGA
jgi:hypothetical protein